MDLDPMNRYVVFYSWRRDGDGGRDFVIMRNPHIGGGDSYNGFKKLADNQHPGAAFKPWAMVPVEALPLVWEYPAEERW